MDQQLVHGYENPACEEAARKQLMALDPAQRAQSVGQSRATGF